MRITSEQASENHRRVVEAASRLFREHGFELIAMGPRVLRTDTACIALLALLHDALRRS